MKFFNGILKWLASFLFSLAAGVGAVALSGNYPQLSTLIDRLIMLGAVSLICSLFLRILFHKGWAILLILLSLITSTASVLILDYFYDSALKFTFFTWNFQFFIPTTQDIAQLVLMLVISLPILLLFRKKKVKKTTQVVEPRKQTSLKTAGQSFSDRVKVVTYQINPKNWNIKFPRIGEKPAHKVKTSSSTKSASPKVRISSPAKTSIKTAVKKPAAAAKPSKKLKLPKFGVKAHQNDVKLATEEEHVCPYCLEEVIENGPLGVVICKECGTWHHQDCWDITGACGVAHRNKL